MVIHRARWRLWVVGLGVLAGIWVEAAAGAGTVTGSVQRNGAPVTGVRVVIDSASDSRYGASASTDQNGAFSFSNVPVGGVQLKAYDGNDQFLVAASATLQYQGQTITVSLDVP